MTTSLIFIGDTHINSTVALCPSGVALDDGGTYRPSNAQRWLWRNWVDFWSKAGEQPGRKIVVFNGDMAELDTKRRSVQLITANKATIIKMVLLAIEPALAIAESVLVIRGTPAHTGKGAWIEEAIAADLDHAIPNEVSASHYHARLTIDGVRLDIAHHAPMSGVPWSKNTGANTLAMRLLWYYRVSMHKAPPHLAIRAHNHRAAVGFASEGGDNIEVRYLPAWSLATEYTYRAGYENALADIGGLFVRINDGRYEVEPVIYPYRISEGELWQKI